MGIKGIEIKFTNIDMIRRYGKKIHCDPTMARRYVNKGYAEYIGVINPDMIQNRVLSLLSSQIQNIPQFFRETIFPPSIIAA